MARILGALAALLLSSATALRCPSRLTTSVGTGAPRCGSIVATADDVEQEAALVQKREAVKIARATATEAAAQASAAAEATASLWEEAEKIWENAKSAGTIRDGTADEATRSAYGLAAFEARLQQEYEDELAQVAKETAAEADKLAAEAAAAEALKAAAVVGDLSMAAGAAIGSAIFEAASSEELSSAAGKAGKSLLTTLFGEPKTTEEIEAARRRRDAAAFEEAEEEQEDDEAEGGPSAAAGSSGFTDLSDDELRRRREEAQAVLKNRRPRRLSETVAESTWNAALSAAEAAGASSSWAAEQRDKARRAAEAQAKADRLALFASDLELLGIQLDEARELDEPTLRRAFRERARVLHPDVRGHSGAGAPGDGEAGEQTQGHVPSVYELNAAFEAVKKLL